MATIACVGLGNMGGPMAANLVRAGHAVTGFDLSAAACDAARATGVAVAPSAAAAAAGAEVVLTMLPAGQHLVEAYEGGLVAGGAGRLAVHRFLHRRRGLGAACPRARGCGRHDVGRRAGLGRRRRGRRRHADLHGGRHEAALERARPFLAAMGKRVVACGGPGAGQAAKMCNNMILGIAMIGISEAFVLAEKLGLDHQALYDVASTSSGQCWALTNHCPVPGPVPASAANHGYRPGFATALMLKDLTLARDAAAAVGAETALGAMPARSSRASPIAAARRSTIRP